MKTVNQHVGRQIHARRKALGLTLIHVAANLGVTFQQCHKYESGSSAVTAARMHQLCSALDVRADYFFQGLK